jgi:signal transduction histidine kinase/HAMP domain-containing protein
LKRDSLLLRVIGPHLGAALLGVVVMGVVFSAAGTGGWASFVAASGAILIATALASVYSYQRLAAPLDRLADDADHVARGHAYRVTPSGPVETRRLSDAVNRMAEELAGVIEELRVETSLREQILASMREGVILAGPSSDLIYANQAAAQMFGKEPLELVPPQLERLGEQEFTVYHPRRRELRSTSVRLEDGRILSVIQDETERKRVESIRRDFVANASHELKTPVAGILVTAESVEQAMDEDGELANLVREARRLSALVQDLLDLARLEERTAEVAVVPFTEVVQEEVAAIRDRVVRKDLALEVDLVEDVEVLGGREDLEVMVRNLLENAVGYTSSGTITVTLRDTGEDFELAVADTGVGIPTSDLERIFERFYRVDRARSRETGGTGLGLSIVRHVAERSGGSVRAVSELGHGSTFLVRLPYPPARPKPESPP